MKETTLTLKTRILISSPRTTNSSWRYDSMNEFTRKTTLQSRIGDFDGNYLFANIKDNEDFFITLRSHRLNSRVKWGEEYE